MLVQFGDFVVGGSGSAGGNTYARNRGGSYRRNKVTPLNPSTPFQVAARSVLAALSTAWRALTQGERDAWDLAVDDFKYSNVFGEQKRHTGKNLNTSLNAALATVGVAAITAPPAPAAVAEPVITAVTIALGAGTFDIAFTGGDASVTYQIWATPSKSQGVSFFKPFYKLFSTAGGATASPLDVSAAYTARFGAPVVGQKISVRLVPVNITTGQIGIGSEAFATVVA